MASRSKRNGNRRQNRRKSGRGGGCSPDMYQRGLDEIKAMFDAMRGV